MSNPTDPVLCSIGQRRWEATDQRTFLNVEIDWSDVLEDLTDEERGRIRKDAEGDNAWLCPACTDRVISEPDTLSEVRCAICRQPKFVKNALRVDLSGCAKDDVDEKTMSAWVRYSCHEAVSKALEREGQGN